MAKGHLSAVPGRPQGAIEAALSGSRRDVLVAMRSALASKLDAGQVAGNSIGAAYRELREVDRLIREADLETDEAKAPRPDARFDLTAI